MLKVWLKRHRRVLVVLLSCLASILVVVGLYLLFRARGLEYIGVLAFTGTVVGLGSGFIMRKRERPPEAEPVEFQESAVEQSVPAEPVQVSEPVQAAEVVEQAAEPTPTKSKKRSVSWGRGEMFILAMFVLTATALAVLLYRFETALSSGSASSLPWLRISVGVAIVIAILLLAWWLIAKKPLQGAKMPKVSFGKVLGWAVVLGIIAVTFLYVQQKRKKSAIADAYAHEFHEALMHPMVTMTSADSAQCHELGLSLPVRGGWTGFISAPDYYRITWQRLAPGLPYAVQNAQGDSAEYWPYQGPHDLPVSGAVRFRALNGKTGRIAILITPRFTCTPAEAASDSTEAPQASPKAAPRYKNRPPRIPGLAVSSCQFLAGARR